MIVNVTKENFNEELFESNVPCIVDFWATWCGPCKALSRELKDLSDEMGDEIKICKINVDEERELSMNYGILSIPTIMYFKDGKLIKSLIG